MKPLRLSIALTALLVLLFISITEGFSQKQAVSELLKGLNLKELNLPVGAVLRQTKNGKVLNKQLLKKMGQNFGNCIGNDVEIEFDSKQKMAWFSSASKEFSCDGGVLINQNGQWKLQELNITLPQNDIPLSKPKRDLLINILTFNLRYGTANDGNNSWYNRDHLVFDIFKNYDPDIVGVQEGLLFQLEEIQQNVPKYSWIGVGRDDGVEEGEFAAIFYDPNRFEVLEQGTFWYCDTPSVPGCTSYGNNLPRICTWGRFLDKTSSSTFYFYNTHLDHQSVVSREKSAVQLIEFIKNVQSSDPTFITGDFNAGESTNEVLTIKNAGFDDSFRVLYPNVTNANTRHDFKGDTSGTKIDYVFTPRIEEFGGPSKVLEAMIIHDNDNGRYPSDHFPVYASVFV